MSLETIEHLRRDAVPFRSESELSPLIQFASGRRFVLLGEASHGTSEFYTLRAAISKELIQKHGFRYIAVEGDWPACYKLNQYVKRLEGGPDSLEEAMQAFQRWPAWMWANEEIADLVEWLRNFNDSLPEDELKAGFYGLDVYSLWESLDELLVYLEQKGSTALHEVRQAIECFETYNRDEQAYAVASGLLGEHDCEDEVIALLTQLRNDAHSLQFQQGKLGTAEEDALSAEINAIVGVNAESYYRTMVKGDAESWNIRDRHMVQVLQTIASFYGSSLKGIVWEHNTHIGDARATDMAADGMVNVGQLVREQYGDKEVCAVGFGTYRGTVIAGHSWGAPLEVMNVPPAQAGSWEDLLHQAGEHNKFILSLRDKHQYKQAFGHRAIGVVYHPARERFGNYVPSIISDRYDAFIYVEESSALHPIPVRKPAFV